jgi:serine-type D-Ala-D-Ala carboxypeptidase/endopeptidase (penicillin-binding protein 4)
MSSMKYLVSTGVALAAIAGLLTSGYPVDGAGSPAIAQQSPASTPQFDAPAGAAPAPAATPVSHPAVASLHGDLREVLSRYNTGAMASVLVVSLDHGDTIFSHNADMLLAPASNMKLYSTAAALYYLGPDFRYSTYVLGTGDVRNGVLDGDLVLYGTGDPAISGRMLGSSLNPFRALADTLAAQGIAEVRGDLVGDGSYFDAEWLGRGWSPENFGAAYSAPVGALSFAENVASFSVRPGAVGSPAVITTIPATIGLAVVNRTTTAASGQTAVRFEYAPEGLVVSGRIARGHGGVNRTIPVVDPVNFAAAAFRSVLESRGIRVTGLTRTVTDASQSPVSLFSRRGANDPNPGPHPRVLGVHLSPTLSEIISVTNHVSHNLFAEALLKTVGRVALGEGSFDAGARAIRYFLECETEPWGADLAIVDGSGLSPLNRVTARSIIQLLDVMTRNQHWETYLESLPQAGYARPRGLQRMRGTPAERNLRAKTGTIRNASSLSGYLAAANGERIAFAIVANQLPASTWAAKRIEDAIGARLASFERPVIELGRDEPVLAVADSPSSAVPPPGTATEREAEPAIASTPAPAAAAESAPRTHQVRSGDTLDGIARTYGISIAEIQRSNPGVNARRLQIGQTILLPNE